MVRAINMFPRTFFEIWLGSLLVLSEGTITKLSSPVVKIAYMVAAPAAIAFSLTCLLISRMTLLTSLFLLFVLTTCSGLVSLALQDSVYPAQSLLMGIAASAFALLFDSLIVKIRSR
tara:strand:- start:567 stop:917 length:351 start_codon:yes stop_codon:yes gene_type:complete